LKPWQFDVNGQQLPPALQKWLEKFSRLYALGSVGVRRNVEFTCVGLGSGTGIGFLRKEWSFDRLAADSFAVVSA
jgi:hypothetical protein